MRLSELTVNLQCLLRRRPGLDERVMGPDRVEVAVQYVGVCQPGVGQGVDGVSLNGLVKILDALLQTVRRPLVPEIPPL